jgi:hypothetical protein
MAMSIRRRSRAAIVSLAIVGGFVLLPAGSASAHVHGITPLRCVGAANAGANQTDVTPASASRGGPISGLIPSTVGNAPLVAQQSGGFDTPACPAA